MQQTSDLRRSNFYHTGTSHKNKINDYNIKLYTTDMRGGKFEKRFPLYQYRAVQYSALNTHLIGTLCWGPH